MKAKTFILIITLTLISCRAEDVEGIWLGEDEKWDSFIIANFSNDSLAFKYLSSYNYHLSKKEQVFLNRERIPTQKTQLTSNTIFRIA